MAYYRKYISTQEARRLRKEPAVQMLPERQTRDSGPWLGGNDIAAVMVDSVLVTKLFNPRS